MAGVRSAILWPVFEVIELLVFTLSIIVFVGYFDDLEEDKNIILVQ